MYICKYIYIYIHIRFSRFYRASIWDLRTLARKRSDKFEKLMALAVLLSSRRLGSAGTIL